MPKRQSRGLERMTQLLDAAAAEFAAVGYAKATTNAIARRAGVSPGTLYQFFGNKEAMAEALSARYLSALEEAHATAFDPAHAALPDTALIDRMVDPMIAVNVANPGFKALFSTGMPAHLSAPTQALHKAVAGKIAAVLAARHPELPPDTVTTTATVATHIFGALMAAVVNAPESDRPRWTRELKRALQAYLAGVVGTDA